MKMKTQVGILSVVVALLMSAPALAGPPKAKAKEVSPVEVPVVRTPPALPLGIGPIRIGMTKEAISALPVDGDIALVAPLVENKKWSKPEKDKLDFDASLKSPLTKSPAKITLVFELGLLTYFSIELDASALADAESQLTTKYGAPKITVDATEEQCIYRNGANFKLPNNRRDANWEAQAVDGNSVRINVSSGVFSVCPSSLRSSGPNSIDYYSLSFSRFSPKAQEPVKPSVF